MGWRSELCLWFVYLIICHHFGSRLSNHWRHCKPTSALVAYELWGWLRHCCSPEPWQVTASVAFQDKGQLDRIYFETVGKPWFRAYWNLKQALKHYLWSSYLLLITDLGPATYKKSGKMSLHFYFYLLSGVSTRRKCS